jgi:enoyl-CoA hydratase
MTGRAELTVTGAVARIGFANPDNGYMDRSMEEDLVAAVDRVCDDPAIRVCVLAGDAPGVFIRHYDLKPLAEQSAAMRAKGRTFSEDRPVREGGIHTAMRRMEGSPVIWVAALNGTAMGGGFELALACDLRIVQAGDHIFGLPEVNLGILPGAGGTQRLPRLVGLSRALAMTLTGDTLTAQQMVDWGLALACAPDAGAAAAVMADRLARKPALALAHIKSLVRRASMAEADLLAAERTLFCDLMVQDDAARLLAEGAAGQRSITDEP